MKRTKIESSNIKEVGYDAKTETLEVLFASGGVYQYGLVLRAEFDALMERAAQKEGHPGSYFAKEIRSKHPFTKVEA